jgi:hypothetical protein
MQRNGEQILPLFSWGKSHFLFKMLREFLDFSVRTNSTVNTWTFEIEFLMFSLHLSFFFFFVFCFYVWKKTTPNLYKEALKKYEEAAHEKKVAVLSFIPFQRSLPWPLYVLIHIIIYVYIYIYTHMRRRKKRGLSVTVGPIFHVRYPVAGFSFFK